MKNKSPLITLAFILVTATRCDGDLQPVLGPEDATVDVSIDALEDVMEDAHDGSSDADDDGPTQCSSFGAQVCRTAVCSAYVNCSAGIGVCGESKNCCEGACTEPTCKNLNDQNCRTAACNTYTGCSEGQGTCTNNRNCCLGLCSE